MKAENEGENHKPQKCAEGRWKKSETMRTASYTTTQTIMLKRHFHTLNLGRKKTSICILLTHNCCGFSVTSDERRKKLKSLNGESKVETQTMKSATQKSGRVKERDAGGVLMRVKESHGREMKKGRLG